MRLHQWWYQYHGSSVLSSAGCNHSFALWPQSGPGDRDGAVGGDSPESQCRGGAALLLRWDHLRPGRPPPDQGVGPGGDQLRHRPGPGRVLQVGSQLSLIDWQFISLVGLTLPHLRQRSRPRLALRRNLRKKLRLKLSLRQISSKPPHRILGWSRPLQLP